MSPFSFSFVDAGSLLHPSSSRALEPHILDVSLHGFGRNEHRGVVVPAAVLGWMIAPSATGYSAVLLLLLFILVPFRPARTAGPSAAP